MIVFFDGLIDLDGVAVIDTIALSYSVAFSCCIEQTLLSLT